MRFFFFFFFKSLCPRHQIATRSKDTGESAAIHLSGFRSASVDGDKRTDPNTFSEDSVTPLERRLYFSTAHFHLRGGCPALAVEVLSKLPNKVRERERERERKLSLNAHTSVSHIPMYT